MSERSEAPGYEPWSRAAFALAGVALVLFVYLGSRPGGAGPVWVYERGIPLLGLAAGALLAFGIVRSLVRRPALQRGRLHSLLALAVVLWAASFPLAYPSSHEGHPSRLSFRLPFDGVWTVSQAGEDRRRNLLVLRPETRFGITFEPAAAGGAALDRRVLAPADGQVVERGDDELVLRVAEAEYLGLAGLRPDAAAAPGKRVNRGESLGSVSRGALSVFLLDAAGEGIPFGFDSIRVDGSAIEIGASVSAAGLRTGQRVEFVAESEKSSR